MSGSDRVLVTGATGYIATHVVQQLQQQGYQVRGTVRSLGDEQKIKPLLNLCPDAKYPVELVEAELTKADDWLDAVRDCKYVQHIASPFPPEEPEDEQELIAPTVEGTLHVLRACQEAKCVKRVVLTSSLVAITGQVATKGHVYTEEDWSDIATCKTAYYKSKTLAEKAAWDFIASLPADEKFELTTIQPGFVMGPILCGSLTTSMGIIKRMMLREMPALPRIHSVLIDVRDVAAAHIAAMTIPEASGKRHLTGGVGMWFGDIAQVLDKEFKPQGYSVPTTNAPNWIMHIVGRLDHSVKMILPILGAETLFKNTRFTDVLGIKPRPVKDTIIETAYSMIEKGFVDKTPTYTGPSSHGSSS